MTVKRTMSVKRTDAESKASGCTVRPNLSESAIVLIEKKFEEKWKINFIYKYRL